MKRSYPYTGPGAAPGAGTPAAGMASNAAGAGPSQTPDYSSYGYGPVAGQQSAGTSTGANASNDAQQAQWHQQWQQYYAQQAAAAAAATQSTPAAPVQQPQHYQQPQQQYAAPPQQPFARPAAAHQYNAAPQPQQQYGAMAGHGTPHQVQPHTQPRPPQQAFYGQYPAQQTAPAQPQQMQAHAAPWQQQQQHVAPMQSFTAAPAPVATPQMPQQGFYGGPGPSQMSPSGPAAKRQRLDHGSGARPPYNQGSPNHAHPPAFGGPQYGMAGSPGRPAMGGPRPPFAGALQKGRDQRGNAPQHRSGPTPHMGGPSNMAAPMAAASQGAMGGHQPRPFGALRQGRNQAHGLPARASHNNGAGPSASSGKFNGPVGVNAIGPASGSARNGFGQRGLNAGANKSQGREGRQSQQSAAGGRNGRQETAKNGAAGKRNDAKSAPTGPAATSRPNETTYNLQKPAFAQGKLLNASDQPVPINYKRTHTDFKIRALDIPELDWSWNGADDDQDASTSLTETAHAEGEKAMKAEETVPSDKNKDGKRARLSRKKPDLGKEVSRMRICFAANLPPANAPTGPKALTASGTKKQGAKSDAPAAEAKAKVSTEEQETNDEADDGDKNDVAWTAFSRGPPPCSTNRVTISYASNLCRLVIDADSIKSLTLHREESYVDIVVDVVTAPGVKRKDQQDKKKGEEWVVIKGVLLESRESDADNYSAVPRRELEKWWREKQVTRESASVDAGKDSTAKPDDSSVKDEVKEDETDMAADPSTEGDVKEEEPDSEADGAAASLSDPAGETKEHAKDSEEYKVLPPFYRLLDQHEGPEEDYRHPAHQLEELTLRVSVSDIASSAKWVCTGDVADWLSLLPGIQSSLGVEPISTWVSKIHVLDPEPPPAFADVVNEWNRTSLVGQTRERQMFLEEAQIESAQGLGELVARLVRGDRPMQTPPRKELGDPLKDVLSTSLYQSSHSFLSLSMLAIMRTLQEYSAQLDESANELTLRLQELMLCIPLRSIFRALDSLCKDSVDKQRQKSMEEKAKRKRDAEKEAASNATSRAASDAPVADVKAMPQASEGLESAADAVIAPIDGEDQVESAEAAETSTTLQGTEQGDDSATAEQLQDDAVDAAAADASHEAGAGDGEENNDADGEAAAQSDGDADADAETDAETDADAEGETDAEGEADDGIVED